MLSTAVESSGVQVCVESSSGVQSTFVYNAAGSPVESRFVLIVADSPVESMWIMWGMVKY